LILSTLGMAYGKLGIRNEAIASHEAALALSARYAPEFESECYGNLGITLVNCDARDRSPRLHAPGARAGRAESR
jgi:hypothetical protein